MFMALLALAAASAPALAPGLWEVRNMPRAATLDGRVLSDLPLGKIKAERLCVTATDTAAPAAWLARDTAGICRITQGIVEGGRIAIRGACPTDRAGKDGTLALDGRYAAGTFTMRFATTTPQPEGVMRFSGTMSGRRLGECPPTQGAGPRAVPLD